MIKIEKVGLFGFEAAIRGMRNPMNSWDLSDTKFDNFDFPCEPYINCKSCIYYGESMCMADLFKIGGDDLDLMMGLASAGPVHAKYRRMIHVQMDVTAPLYWWKEYDTYKVGTVANSCSTMHKIHAKPFELNDFSHDHLLSMVDIECHPNEYLITELDEDLNSVTKVRDDLPLIYAGDAGLFSPMGVLHVTIRMLNRVRELYLKSKDKKYWWQLIQLLPSSYNQRRTIDLNYEVLSHMYHDRKNHKLDEWRIFCEWIESLPYSEIITGKEDHNE